MRRVPRPVHLTLAVALALLPVPSPASAAGGAAPAHHHGKAVHLGAGDAVPQIELRVEPDSMSGVNVFVEVRHFRFAPENAGLANAPGEGHAHLYVDGENVARVYGWRGRYGCPRAAGR